ncbi:MAG: hypothetical protein WC702_00085 [Patescibacteria group bacterium]|jgi:hypothetical protein
MENTEKNLDELSNKILERIDKEGVKQIPGWWFKTKNILFWTLWIVFVVGGGSLAVSAMAFHTRFAGWDFYQVTHGSLGNFIIDTFPYIWLIILAVFLVIGYEDIKNTKKGYKYTFSLIAGLSLVTCLIGGFVLYAVGLGRLADENIGPRLPFGHSAMERQGEFWSKPNEGLLFGNVVSINNDNETFVLSDKNGSEWTVNVSQLSETDKAAIETNANIRLIGWREDDDSAFNACFVILWGNEMRPTAPNRKDCDNDYCPLPPTPVEVEQKIITSCKDLPGYKFLLDLKETAE